MRVLCVAEKPSISKEISRILSGGQREVHNTGSPYVKNYEFDYPQTNSQFIMTCVSGHLLSWDFPPQYRNWNGCDPGDLFDVEPQFSVEDRNKPIEQNILNLARRVDMLMIWTDCDREGENIGMEIANICRRVKPNIRVKRARFSAIIDQQIHRAAQNPVELDRRQSDAVEARIFLDLKVGSAFTRLQSLRLGNSLGAERKLLSYGPCQFPTLGFVVERFMKVKDFRPERFWYIHLALSRRGEGGQAEDVEFKWKRGHVFDRHIAVSLYTRVLDNPRARVLNVTKKETKKWKPLPLTTVELQKAGSRLLKMTPKKVLQVAEQLYQKGFVSYPRTETDQFDNQFDLMTLINKQAVDPGWGDFAQKLQNGGFTPPRKGKNNDKAHPPIHPTAHAANLSSDEKRVYEYIVRRYLACCSKDARGMETMVNVICGGEEFSTSGLIVLEKNYLEVYPYDKWASRTLPNFEQGEEFDPSVCTLNDGNTSPPKYLTEADLVTLMDKNGIGTDATIAQHIETIVTRDYVLERMEGAIKYLVPTTLGIGLIEGYNELGLPKSVSKPSLRRETERRMVQVCEGTMDKAEMLRISLELYKEMYNITRREFERVANSVRRYVHNNGAAEPNEGPAGGGGGAQGGGPRGGGGGGGGGGGNNRGNGNGGAPRGAAPRPPTSRNGRGDNAPPPNADSDDDYPPPPPARQPQPPRAPAVATGPRSKPASSSRAPARPSRKQSARSSDTTCECGLPAIQTKATAGASKGRLRWGCSVDVCAFFQWVSDDPTANQSLPASSTIPAKRSYPSSSSNTVTAQTSAYQSTVSGLGGDEDARKCAGCGKDAVQKTVTKESANKGRMFWKCVDSQNTGNKECESFFEWSDEPSRPKGGGGGSMGMGSGGGGGGGAPCYKCNQEGHWASACPNGDGGMNKRPRSFASSRGGGAGTPNSNIRCFKCQEPGHLSPDCPGGGSGSYSKSTSQQGGGANSGSGECYKCGNGGHWAKDCPGEGKSMGRTGSSSSYKSSGGSKRGGRGGGRGASSSKRGRGAKVKKSAFAAADFR